LKINNDSVFGVSNYLKISDWNIKMAIGIHVVRVAFLAISTKTGVPINKEDPNTTIRDTLQTEHRHVIIPDNSVPNSANYPTVDAYLKLEAAGNYILGHMDQNMIITYDQSTINAA
jgi:hypothetical protein